MRTMQLKSLAVNYTPGDGSMVMGAIRKGAPKESNRSGRDLDHFRITLKEGFAHLQPYITELYGAEPREISNVRFLSEIDGVLQSANEIWGNGKLKQRCDGETISQWQDPESQRIVKGARGCPRMNGGKCDCKTTGRLYVYLPDLTFLSGAAGRFVLKTGSITDIQHFYSVLMDTRSWHIVTDPQTGDEYSTIRGVPFVLGREKRPMPQVLPGKDGGAPQLTSVPMWMLTLHTDDKLIKRLADAKHFQLPPPTEDIKPILVSTVPSVPDPDYANRAPNQPAFAPVTPPQAAPEPPPIEGELVDDLIAESDEQFAARLMKTAEVFEVLRLRIEIIFKTEQRVYKLTARDGTLITTGDAESLSGIGNVSTWKLGKDFPLTKVSVLAAQEKGTWYIINITHG